MCNVFASERRQKHLNPLIKTGENTENIFKLQLEHYFTTMIGWITTNKFQVEVLFSPPCRQAWGTEPGGGSGWKCHAEATLVGYLIDEWTLFIEQYTPILIFNVNMNQILGQSKFLQYRISPILSENQSCRQLCLQPARLFHQTVTDTFSGAFWAQFDLFDNLKGSSPVGMTKSDNLKRLRQPGIPNL